MLLAVRPPSLAELECAEMLRQPCTSTGIMCIITLVMCSTLWHSLQGCPDQC